MENKKMGKNKDKREDWIGEGKTDRAMAGPEASPLLCHHTTVACSPLTMPMASRESRCATAHTPRARMVKLAQA